MPGPSPPADSLEILDPDDLITVPPEEHTTSQTRRLGSKPSAAADLAAKQGTSAAAAAGPAPASATSMVFEDAPSWDGTGKPAGKPYLAGDVIDGKYRLTRIIGRGGMGAVWEAHNIPLDIEVAIKLIRRDRTAPGAGERLLTEARAAARLMHPAIVRVFDFGESSQGDPFIVMELLRGESLNAILRRKKRLTPQVAVQTLLPVAAALASAHAKGIIHRDLKPDNIILVNDDSGALVPKIVDFGIAKLLSPGVDRHVTMAGEVLGSPDYMSPEQARGADNVGEASDIWTYSVVLYELIAGKRPFDGLNYNALISSIITDTPQSLTTLGVGDAALSGIIEHGLTKDVASRWPKIKDMGAALASWAVANGVEDDVMGNPIAKHWLSGAARRLMTVQPETGEAPLRSGPVEPAPAWSAPASPPTQGVAPVHGVSIPRGRSVPSPPRRLRPCRRPPRSRHGRFHAPSWRRSSTRAAARHRSTSGAAWRDARLGWSSAWCCSASSPSWCSSKAIDSRPFARGAARGTPRRLRSRRRRSPPASSRRGPRHRARLRHRPLQRRPRPARPPAHPPPALLTTRRRAPRAIHPRRLP